jgi:O-methyltransferase involved in polyketide biosynthesis
MPASDVTLTGVPETMLWTLHNRACEARRRDTFLVDPDCVRIYESIDYDYRRSFGSPDGSHPMRSRLFDEAVAPWLAEHPGGTVVELAAGLETQFQRCDDGRAQWLCVDVPEAIAVRERFLPASDRCRHVAQSALDPGWMDEVDARRGVFVTAQGLFMYFEEEQVRRLFTAIVDRFPGVELMFDTIPPWFSRRTMKGFRKTRHYTSPPMPWGVRRSELAALLRRWSPRVTEVDVSSYGFSRGLGALALRLFTALPRLRDVPPAIARVRTRGRR